MVLSLSLPSHTGPQAPWEYGSHLVLLLFLPGFRKFSDYFVLSLGPTRLKWKDLPLPCLTKETNRNGNRASGQREGRVQGTDLGETVLKSGYRKSNWTPFKSTTVASSRSSQRKRNVFYKTNGHTCGFQETEALLIQYKPRVS